MVNCLHCGRELVDDPSSGMWIHKEFDPDRGQWYCDAAHTLYATRPPEGEAPSTSLPSPFGLHTCPTCGKEYQGGYGMEGGALVKTGEETAEAFGFGNDLEGEGFLYFYRHAPPGTYLTGPPVYVFDRVPGGQFSLHACSKVCLLTALALKLYQL